MVGIKFSTIAEQRSAELADSLISKLLAAPRMDGVDISLLREEFRGLFADLTEWLLHRSKAEIDAKFTEIGRLHARQGMSLRDSVSAMMSCRDHLVEYLHSVGGGEELFGELEFEVALGNFFDDAIFFLMKGHGSCQLVQRDIA